MSCTNTIYWHDRNQNFSMLYDHEKNSSASRLQVCLQSFSQHLQELKESLSCWVGLTAVGSEYKNICYAWTAIALTCCTIIFLCLPVLDEQLLYRYSAGWKYWLFAHLIDYEPIYEHHSSPNYQSLLAPVHLPCLLWYKLKLMFTSW